MKKIYNQPKTTIQQTCLMNTICVGSVHGGNLNYGGSGSGIEPI